MANEYPHRTTQSLDQSEDQENQQEQEKSIDQQDEVNFSYLFTSLIGGNLAVGSEIGQTIGAFKTLSDPKLAESLLDVKDPKKLKKILTARERLEGRFKSKKTRERGFSQFRFAGFHGKITTDAFDKQSHALEIAKKVHGLVNTREEQIKIERVVNRFGFGDEHSEQLRKSLTDFQKKNPGRQLDDELLKQARFLQRQQRSQERKDVKDKDVKNDITGARQQAIEELDKKGVLKRAEVVLNTNVLPPDAPKVTNEQLQEQVAYIANGTLLKTGELTQQKLSGGFAEIPMDLADAIMGEDIPAKPKQPSTPQKPPDQPPPPPPPPISAPSPRQFSLPQIHLPSFKLPQGLSNMFSGFQNSLSKMFGGLGGKLGSMFGKNGLASKGMDLLKNGAKMLVNRGLDAIAPGLGTALDKINEGIKNITRMLGFEIDPEALVIGLTVGLAVGVPVLFIILFQLKTTNNTASDPIIIASNPEQSFSWQQFEKKILTREAGEPKSVSWSQFEQEFLIPPSHYISRKEVVQ